MGAVERVGNDVGAQSSPLVLEGEGQDDCRQHHRDDPHAVNPRIEHRTETSPCPGCRVHAGGCWKLAPRDPDRVIYPWQGEEGKPWPNPQRESCSWTMSSRSRRCSPTLCGATATRSYRPPTATRRCSASTRKPSTSSSWT